MNDVKTIPDTLTLLVKSLSDEVEARFQKSFDERDAQLNLVTADVIMASNTALLALQTAQKYFDEVDNLFKTFCDTPEFDMAFRKYLNNFLSHKMEVIIKEHSS